MTPIYFQSLSNDQYNEHRHEHEFLSPNSQASLSSNSLTCHIFFNPISTHDQDEAFDKDQSHPSQIKVIQIELCNICWLLVTYPIKNTFSLRLY